MSTDTTPYVIAPVRELVRPIVGSMMDPSHVLSGGGGGPATWTTNDGAGTGYASEFTVFDGAGTSHVLHTTVLDGAGTSYILN